MSVFRSGARLVMSSTVKSRSAFVPVPSLCNAALQVRLTCVKIYDQIIMQFDSLKIHKKSLIFLL